MEFLRSRKNLLAPFVLFLLAFTIYLSIWHPVPTSDVTVIGLTGHQLAKHGNFYLDEYTDEFAKLVESKQIREIDGHYVSKYPVFGAVASAPFFWVGDKLLMPHFGGDLWTYILLVGHVASAFIAALSGVVMLGVLRAWTSFRKAVVLTLVFLFATSLWSVGSTMLWQHGVSILFSALALLLLSRLIKRGASKPLLVVLGFILGCLVAARITNLVTLLVFFAVLAYYYRRNLLKLAWVALGGLPVALLLLAYNLHYLGDVFSTGYLGEGTQGWSANPIYGFLGLLFSPSKGIFVLMPVLAMGLAFFVLKFRGLRLRRDFILLVLCFAVFIFQALLYSKWWAWYGGYSWGGRMLSDTLPYLVFLLVPFVESKWFQKNSVKLVFGVLVVWGVYVQLLGVLSWDRSWHINYDMETRSQRWLWSPLNNQVLYYMKRQIYYLSYPRVDKGKIKPRVLKADLRQHSLEDDFADIYARGRWE